MNKPSPAIVAQSAVRRLPRLALLLFCLAYVLPGFLARSPWKTEDIAAFGVMHELSSATTNWLAPQLLAQTAGGVDALAPYWLGALAIGWLPFLDSAFAARVPFIFLLVLTLLATWYAVYYLAKSPQAQPVAFAFGGEASPTDYARAIADAGVLALMACLGLAQLSHETTPASAQLGFTALTFCAMAASPHHKAKKTIALGLLVGLAGLALSGAPTLAALLGLGGAAVEWAHARWGNTTHQNSYNQATKVRRQQPCAPWVWLTIGITALVCGLAYGLDVWRWRIQLPGTDGQPAVQAWHKLGRLLLWFTWPAWPLALWTLWRWRWQLASRHVALPLWFAVVAVTATLTSTAADRSLLLGLPALAALAAFALPTLRRSVAALIDWFTLLFFTGCGLIIWVVWLAMQTGVPRQPAANVARLAPGFEPSFSWVAFLIATGATLAWAGLVYWRTRAHRAAIWKSLVLPSAGATLCWLLLMTLWLPLLDHARSYELMSRQIVSMVDKNSCIEVYGVSTAHAAGLRYHGQLKLRAAQKLAVCPYLIANATKQTSLASDVNLQEWDFQARVGRTTDKSENVLIFKRVSADDERVTPSPIQTRKIKTIRSDAAL